MTIIPKIGEIVGTGTEAEIVEIEKEQEEEVGVGTETMAESDPDEAAPNLETELIRVTRMEEKDKLAEEMYHYIGMFRRRGLSMLLPCSTRQCKHPEKSHLP